MKKEKMYIQFNTRFKLDHLTFGWMCPLCQKVYSPYVQECPEKHRLVDEEGKWERVDEPKANKK